MSVNSMRKRLSKYTDTLETLGFEVMTVEPTGSGHFRIRFKAGKKPSSTVVPTSTSDKRSFLNWRSQMRRIAVEQGTAGG